jgi:hypothetical protein
MKNIKAQARAGVKDRQNRSLQIVNEDFGGLLQHPMGKRLVLNSTYV